MIYYTLPDGKLISFNNGIQSNNGRLLVAKRGFAYGNFGETISINSGWERNGCAIISGILEITNNGNKVENGFCIVLIPNVNSTVVRFDSVAISIAGRFQYGEVSLGAGNQTQYSPNFKRYVYILFDFA